MLVITYTCGKQYAVRWCSYTAPLGKATHVCHGRILNRSNVIISTQHFELQHFEFLMKRHTIMLTGAHVHPCTCMCVCVCVCVCVCARAHTHVHLPAWCVYTSECESIHKCSRHKTWASIHPFYTHTHTHTNVLLIPTPQVSPPFITSSYWGGGKGPWAPLSPNKLITDHQGGFPH